MSSFVAHRALDMADFITNGSISEFFDYGDVITATPTTFVVSYADETISERLTFTGVFENYVDGYPTSGTITSASYWLDGSDLFSINQMSMSVQTFTSYALSDDLAGLFAEILGGNDVLSGSADGDVLLGFAGDDNLFGNLGNDTLVGGDGFDTANYSNANGGVSVNLANGGSSGADGNDTLSGIERIVGSAYNDALAGDAGANVLEGGAGADTLVGDDGDDTLRGGAGNDRLYGGAGNDFLSEASGDNGPFGNDLYNGGEGSDRVSLFTTYGPGVTVDLRITTAQNTGQGFDTFLGVEHITGSYGNNVLIGDGFDNWLWTFQGNDTFAGNGGNDYLVVGTGDKNVDGGTGVDTLDFADFAFEPVYNPQLGLTLSLALQGAVQSTNVGSWTIDNIENLGGWNGADHLTGDGNANVLAGNIGNDSLVGGAGNDTLAGDGTFIFENGAQVFIAENTADGPGGDDVLEGGLGNDTLIGGGGLDIAVYEHANAGVAVNLATGTASGGDGNDTLQMVEGVIGSGFTDSLSGDGLANRLYGGGGDDTIAGVGGDDFLDGGAGIDKLYGGLGNDRYIVDDGNDRVFESAGQGNDTVYSYVTFGLRAGLEVESLRAVDIAATLGITLAGNEFSQSIVGNAGDNSLIGLGGNDTLDGGAGVDRLYGGVGNDIYIVDNGNDRVTEAVGEGSDTVMSSVTYGLRADAEIELLRALDLASADPITLAGNDFSQTIKGNAGDNSLIGLGGNDLLDGGAGVDRLYGGTGNDGYIVDNANDRVTENAGEGTDTVYASVSYALRAGVEVETMRTADPAATSALSLTGNEFGQSIVGNAGANTLIGLGGNDTLDGGAGADRLYGGTGNDLLVGGGGADNFVIADLGGTDRIADFARGEDVIDLRQIDANNGVAGDQAFTFIGANAFTGTAGQVQTYVSNGVNYVAGDVNGDGVADFVIDLGSVQVQGSDILL